MKLYTRFKNLDQSGKRLALSFFIIIALIITVVALYVIKLLSQELSQIVFSLLLIAGCLMLLFQCKKNERE